MAPSDDDGASAAEDMPASALPPLEVPAVPAAVGAPVRLVKSPEPEIIAAPAFEEMGAMAAVSGAPVERPVTAIGLPAELALAGASEVVEEVAVVVTDGPVSVLLPEASVVAAGVTAGAVEDDAASPAGEAIGALEPPAEIECAGALPTPIIASVWTVLPAALPGAFGALAAAGLADGEAADAPAETGAVEGLAAPAGAETTAGADVEELEMSAAAGAAVEGAAVEGAAGAAGAAAGAGAATGAVAGATAASAAGAGAGAGAGLPLAEPVPLGATGWPEVAVEAEAGDWSVPVVCTTTGAEAVRI